MHCLSSRQITGGSGLCRETVRSLRGPSRSPGCPPPSAPTTRYDTPPPVQPPRGTDMPQEPGTGCAPIPSQDAPGYPGRGVRTPSCTPHCLIHPPLDSKALPHRPRASIEEEGRAGAECPVPPWQSTARTAAPGHPGEPQRDTAPASRKVPVPRRAEHGATAQVAVHGVVLQLHWSPLVLQPAGQ